MSNSSLEVTVMPRFKQMPQDPSQMWLLPPSLDEMIGKDDEARVLSEVMDQLDWSILESTYKERGTPAYPPKALTKVLVFAYSKGIRSSRKIEELLENDLRYMWLAGGLKPDFHTIARFRKDKFDSLCKLFVDSVRLCKSLGLVNLNIVAFDGTKVGANASKKSLYDQKRLNKELEQVREILREADDVDDQEDAELGDRNGREIPESLRDAKNRKRALEELKKKLDQSNSKLMSSSDTDCRLMKTRDGFKTAFNVQAAVDSERQVVVGMKVTGSENDHGQLAEMLSEVEKNCGMSAVMALADTGYCDEPTLMAIEEMGQEALIALGKRPSADKADDLFASRNFLADPERDVLICPAGRELSFSVESQCGSGRYRVYSAHGCASCSFWSQCVKSGRGSRRVSVSCNERARHRMREKLSREGCKTLYGLRSQVIEPVFGQIKHDRGFRKFLLRGLNGATAEMSLVFLVHNLLKCSQKAAILAYPAGFVAAREFIYWMSRLLWQFGRRHRQCWASA
jgi:transposase